MKALILDLALALAGISAASHTATTDGFAVWQTGDCLA
jgi:hypothetical protein